MTTAIDPIGPGTTGTTPGRPVENPGALLDRDAFLKLLVAQLKYQDPTKPADASQMLAQSAQLTMVDRLNELTEAYQASAASQRLSLAGTIVGREITFVDADGVRTTAVVETATVENEELTVIAGGYAVPFGAILAVHAPPAPAAAPTIPAPPAAPPIPAPAPAAAAVPTDPPADPADPSGPPATEPEPAT